MYMYNFIIFMLFIFYFFKKKFNLLIIYIVIIIIIYIFNSKIFNFFKKNFFYYLNSGQVRVEFGSLIVVNYNPNPTRSYLTLRPNPPNLNPTFGFGSG